MKLSSRKELLSEAENEMKKIRNESKKTPIIKEASVSSVINAAQKTSVKGVFAEIATQLNELEAIAKDGIDAAAKDAKRQGYDNLAKNLATESKSIKNAVSELSTHLLKLIGEIRNIENAVG